MSAAWWLIGLAVAVSVGLAVWTIVRHWDW